MNLGNDAADLIVRYSIAGTEVVLKLSGLAAKNLAMFLVALLKDQKKTRGRTRLIRMLQDGRPPRFFDVPTDKMKEFSHEAKIHGLLFVAIKNKRVPGQHEIMVFADDAAKIQRIMDRMGLDFVKAEAEVGAPVQAERQMKSYEPSRTETIQTEQGDVSFEVGGFEYDFNISEAANFTPARENVAPWMDVNPSAPSSPGKDFSEPTPGKNALPEQKKSVREELKDIQRKIKAKAKKAPVQPNFSIPMAKIKKERGI